MMPGVSQYFKMIFNQTRFVWEKILPKLFQQFSFFIINTFQKSSSLLILDNFIQQKKKSGASKRQNNTSKNERIDHVERPRHNKRFWNIYFLPEFEWGVEIRDRKKYIRVAHYLPFRSSVFLLLSFWNNLFFF